MRTSTRPTHCKDCGRQFRPLHAQAELYPGQPVHCGRGLCPMCHKHQKQRTTSTTKQQTFICLPPEQIQALQDRNLARQRARFEAERSRRGIPPTGERRIHIVLTDRFVPVFEEVA